MTALLLFAACIAYAVVGMFAARIVYRRANPPGTVAHGSFNNDDAIFTALTLLLWPILLAGFLWHRWLTS